MAEIHVERKKGGLRWIIVLLVLVLAAAAGWYFYNQRNNAPDTPGTVGLHEPATPPTSRSSIRRA